MADSLDDLEALHRDLEALKENRMPNIDRLAAELEAHVDEFRLLLDQKKRSNESRQKLYSGQSGDGRITR
jgi:nuclear pore complex protein Nup205